MTDFQRWFTTFLDEKQVDMSESVPCSDGNIQIGDVCSVVMTCPHNEQLTVKRKLVEIDFKNGDVTHFLKFLALKLKTSDKVKL